jgi:hypothetical protein
MSKKRTKYTSGCLAGSSGCQYIDLEHLKNFDISIPPKDVVDSFNETLGFYKTLV